MTTIPEIVFSEEELQLLLMNLWASVDNVHLPPVFSFDYKNYRIRVAKLDALWDPEFGGSREWGPFLFEASELNDTEMPYTKVWDPAYSSPDKCAEWIINLCK